MVLATLRTHWKKSIFFSGVAIYAGRYGQSKWQDYQLMRIYAAEASKYGNLPTFSSVAKNYHVTVVLNPAASGGSAKKKFEETCAPLLNLAGFKVSVIRTEGQGQAKEIMEIMDDTDAVLIGGGDGTLMEAVTGLLRRKDASELARTLPIGVLPIGENNSMAKFLFPDTQRSDCWIVKTVF